MKNFIFIIILSFFLTTPCQSKGVDWARLTDKAILLTPEQVKILENKESLVDDEVFQLGIIYLRKFNTEKLKTLQNRASPESVVNTWLQAIILMKNHNYIESQEILLKIIEDYPEFYPAQVILINTYFLQKKHKKAYLLAKTLMGKKDLISKYHYVTSLLFAGASKGLLAQNNPAKSTLAFFEIKSYFDETQKLMRNSPEVQYGMGAFKLLTPVIAGGSVNKAITYLKRAQAQTPLNPNIYVRLAQAYKRKNNMMKYKEYLSKARQLDSQNKLLLDETLP